MRTKIPEQIKPVNPHIQVFYPLTSPTVGTAFPFNKRLYTQTEKFRTMGPGNRPGTKKRKAIRLSSLSYMK